MTDTTKTPKDEKAPAVNDDQDATVGTAPAKPAASTSEAAPKTSKGDGAKPTTR